MSSVRGKIDNYKKKVGLDGLPLDVGQRKVSVKKEIKEYYKRSKEESNIIKGLILTPFFSYINQLIVLIFDITPLLEPNKKDKNFLLIFHSIKIIVSAVILLIAGYSIRKGFNYQPIRLLFMIIISIVNVLIVSMVLSNKIVATRELNKQKKLEFLDYIDVLSTGFSELMTVGSLGYSLYQYFFLGLRFIPQNMFFLIGKMILSIVTSSISLAE